MSEPEPNPTPQPAAAGAASPAPGPDRRGLLALACAGAASCAGLAGLGAVGRAALLAPLDGQATGGEGPWVDLGPLERLSPGRPVKLPVSLPVRDAWAALPPRTLGHVVVVREGQDARVFSAACPHNGCEVFTRPDALVCPCHDTSFSLQGQVLGGPSPRPLDALEHQVSDGRLRVRWARFLPGIPQRKPV